MEEAYQFRDRDASVRRLLAMAYAHALIEDPRDGTKYRPGDEVPTDLPGHDDLVGQGVISDEEYVPEPVEVAEPNLQSVVEIDENTVQIGDKVYTLTEVQKTSDDGAETDDARI